MKGHRLQALVYSLLIFLLLPVASNLSPVFAAETITPARISPSSPLYFLKSVREILELKFAPTTHIRSLRELEFANRRIREVKSLVNTPGEDLIQPTLEKYWSGLGQLIGISDLRDENQAAEVTRSINLHMNLLQEIFSQVSSVQAKRSIRATVFRLSGWDERLISKLSAGKHFTFVQEVINSKSSACSFLAQEASSSALNETERIVSEERAKTCFKDLTGHNKPEADRPQLRWHKV